MDRKIQLTKEAQDKLKEKEESEGKTPDELGSEIVGKTATEETREDKPKAKRGRKPKPTEQNNGKQPFINAYGFIHLNPKMMETIGATKGAKTPVKIETRDGTLVISKA